MVLEALSWMFDGYFVDDERGEERSQASLFISISPVCILLTFDSMTSTLEARTWVICLVRVPRMGHGVQSAMDKHDFDAMVGRCANNRNVP